MYYLFIFFCLLLFTLHLYGSLFPPQFSFVFPKIAVFVHCHYRYIVLCYNFYKGKRLKAPKVKLSPQCVGSQQRQSICKILFSFLSSVRIWRWMGLVLHKSSFYRTLPVWPAEQKVSSRGIAGSWEQCIWRNIKERENKNEQKTQMWQQNQLNGSSKT